MLRPDMELRCRTTRKRRDLRAWLASNQLSNAGESDAWTSSRGMKPGRVQVIIMRGSLRGGFAVEPARLRMISDSRLVLARSWPAWGRQVFIEPVASDFAGDAAGFAAGPFKVHPGP